MASDRSTTESILQLLRPYASNWSGTLGRGDLVIPHRDIPRLIHQMVEAIRGQGEEQAEATEADIFQVVSEARRRPSIQDEVALLQQRFIIVKR